MIKTEIVGATSSMTSIPKPLKYLIEHYKPLKEFYETVPLSAYKVPFYHTNE
jgi:hypothetical protein